MNAASLSPLDMFLHAGPVGKFVILLLIAASIWCWVLILEAIWATQRLASAVAKAQSGNEPPALVASVFAAGAAEAGFGVVGETLADTRARVRAAMEREAERLIGRVEGGLPNLAVLSSVAPFIGLFGTVWGIMASFSAIAAAQDTSLAVVAPGIAEALAATAIGLAAAIPASVGYSRLGVRLGRVAQTLGHLIEERALRFGVSTSVEGG